MTVIRGECVAPGVALGNVVLRGYDDGALVAVRLAADEVDDEVRRLQEAVSKSRAELVELKAEHGDTIGADQARIFDVHVALLDDPEFLRSVEAQVREERLNVGAAIAAVVRDYERLFELVENAMLRERAADFRDVAQRVLTHLERSDRTVEAPSGEDGVVLAARRLSVNDLFRLDQGKVQGIVAEEGGMSSHAAILARSMGIPTLSGIRDLADKLHAGAFVIIDAASGELHVEPDERLRNEFQAAAERLESVPSAAEMTERPHQLRDGMEVRLLGACGNLAEAGLASALGMDGIGLYRTELLYLVDGRAPSEDVLVKHYAEVLRGNGDKPAWFRLLDVSSHQKVEWLHGRKERNPALGVRGARALLREGRALRRQVRAILRAAHGAKEVAVLVPFVTSIDELQRVRSAVVEERHQLVKKGVPCAERVRFAPIIEVPATAFISRALLAVSDFVVVGLDDLQSLVLAADRDNPDVAEQYQITHPAMFELCARVASDAKAAKKPAVLFGEIAAQPSLLPFFLGAGYRDFAVAPAHMERMLDQFDRWTATECRKISKELLQAPRALDVQRILFRTGAGE